MYNLGNLLVIFLAVGHMPGCYGVSHNVTSHKDTTHKDVTHSSTNRRHKS